MIVINQYTYKTVESNETSIEQTSLQMDREPETGYNPLGKIFCRLRNRAAGYGLGIKRNCFRLEEENEVGT